MKNFRQQLQDLDKDINSKYNKLIEEVKSVTFYQERMAEFDEALGDCTIVTTITKRGENLDVKVLEISKNSGIFVANDNYNSQRFWIGLNDLSDLSDKIEIIELLENIILKA